MTDEKKLSDEKRYSQIPKESIKCAAESIGIPSLSDEIAAVLSEDVNYRLREVAQNCGQFMRHSKRRKLTVRDFNRALHWNDVEPIYGFNSAEASVFHYCKEAEIHYTEDKEINLLEIALNSPVYETHGPSFLKAQWLAVEGIGKGATSLQGSTGKKNGHIAPTVSEDLMVYYDQMTKAILGNDEELMKVALKDLKTNSKISPLLPFLINFVSIGVKKVSHDLAQLTKLLYTVNALICNQSLYLGPKPYLNLLTQGLLYCILEPLAASINPVNDHWALRDYAARLLAQVIRIWSSPANNLYKDSLEALEEVITDLTKPFCSHYGAVIAMITLGPKAVEKHLVPHVLKYWPHLSSVVDDITFSNVQIRADAQKVYGALLLAAYLTIEHHRDIMLVEQMNLVMEKFPDNVNGLFLSSLDHHEKIVEPVLAMKKEIKQEKDDSQISIAELYKLLYECFGDSLSSRLPHVPVIGKYCHVQKPLLNLFSSPELLQSGEELLETFTVKDEEWQSVSDADDHSYDERDDNSLLSDDGDGEAESVPSNVDLRIKSTVSDPTLGIKLTIAKLPRSSSSTSTNDFSGRSAKRKKLSIKIKKEQLEHSEPDQHFTSTLDLKNRFINIEFCFAGAMPIPKNNLKRSIIIPTFETTYKQSKYYMLSLKMKKKQKVRRSLSSKEKWTRKFNTCSLFTVL